MKAKYLGKPSDFDPCLVPSSPKLLPIYVWHAGDGDQDAICKGVPPTWLQVAILYDGHCSLLSVCFGVN